MNKIFTFILIFIMTGCGFSSGLYKDIIKAQDYISEQKFQKAVDVYESILRKKPSKNIQIKINYHLGEIYSIYLNDYQNSLRHYKTIVKSSNEPNWQVKSLEKIGHIYFENLNEYEKAKKVYHQLMNFVPTLENQDLYEFRYGLSIFYLKKYTESIKVFENIIEKNKKKSAVNSYYYIGLAYFYQQNWVNANKYWFEYLKRETQNNKIVKTKFLIANAYESSEKLKEAYNIYYSILGEYPNPEVIKSRLDSLYKRRIARKR
ncbi:MAG: tetratricopeptide repeat protein [Bacteriovoracaceae bacterium]|nr:tetratricopeptide repeat protein [Bacteriovoracaceae bacterium]|tara:strand:- start:387 stop:1169 length:783 start_codon:yes stop_codon:yes gene_type:complete